MKKKVKQTTLKRKKGASGRPDSPMEVDSDDEEDADRNDAALFVTSDAEESGEEEEDAENTNDAHLVSDI